VFISASNFSLFIRTSASFSLDCHCKDTISKSSYIQATRSFNTSTCRFGVGGHNSAHREQSLHLMNNEIYFLKIQHLLDNYFVWSFKFFPNILIHNIF
jgi:hypothetical protein